MEENEMKIIAGRILLEAQYRTKECCDKVFEAPSWAKVLFFVLSSAMVVYLWSIVLSLKRITLLSVALYSIVLVDTIGFFALIVIYFLDRKYKFLPKRPAE